ncbi:hypothetical protein QUF76_12645, partial [Desulfobacterales bacterium HSG16]|nr:hypothetical protein [Desulfobacterales bacterium HSG16]
LHESIGNPDLLTGRAKEFATFDKWIARIPKRLSKSRAILARRKSGKTAFLQRIFNRLWSENGRVIPFYINISEKKVWYPYFAIHYYRTFASQYISFCERDVNPVRTPLTLDQIRKYGESKSLPLFVTDIDLIREGMEKGIHDQIWEVASTAPDRFAGLYDLRFLVMIDEFQNTGEYIYRDKNIQFVDKTIPGTWHDLSESKLAPILVTGSYVGWLINIIDTYLEAGRLKRFIMNPYLLPEDGLQAVYKYSEYYEEPINNESAVLINRLCMSDPFFISCVIQSEFEEKDLTTEEGVINTVHHEITDRLSEMSMTWGEYIELSLKRINTINAKHILLHLSKHSDQDWTPQKLKDALKLDIDLKEIQKLLQNMVKADLIREGNSDIRYRGLTDGTLCLILQNRFEEEIRSYQPDLEKTDLKKNFHKELKKLKKEKRSLQGMVNHLTGKMAEYQLAVEFRSKKRFFPSQYFTNVTDDTKLNIIDVKMRMQLQRPDGKNMEVDILAESDCGRILAVEVKKTKDPTGLSYIKDFLEKLAVYAAKNPEKQILAAYFSTGGFTNEAQKFCKESSIATAQKIKLF